MLVIQCADCRVYKSTSASTHMPNAHVHWIYKYRSFYWLIFVYFNIAFLICNFHSILMNCTTTVPSTFVFFIYEKLKSSQTYDVWGLSRSEKMNLFISMAACTKQHNNSNNCRKSHFETIAKVSPVCWCTNWCRCTDLAVFSFLCNHFRVMWPRNEVQINRIVIFFSFDSI